MTVLQLTSNIISMIFAAAAAGFWLKSSTVRVPKKDGNKVGPEIIVEGYAFIATATMQAKWSRRGALSAAIAALFQAISLAIPIAAAEKCIQADAAYSGLAIDANIQAEE